MSQENVEVLRLVYEAWNRRPDEILPFLDPEVESSPGLLPPGEEREFLGREGVREWIRSVTDAWVATRVEPKERIEISNDRFLAIDLWHFHGRDGIEVEEELPTIFTFRNGLIVRIDGFTDRTQALEAAGLLE